MSNITQQPNTNSLHTAYHLLRYNYAFSVSNEHLPAITVDIVINNTVFASVDYNRYASRTQNGSNYDFAFEIDIHKEVARFFDNTTPFAPITPKFTAPNLQAAVKVNIYEWLPNTNGILTKQSIPQSSQQIYVLNSLVGDLSVFKYSGSLIRYLTDKPNGTLLSNKEYLSFWNSGIDYTRILFFDANNVQIGVNYIEHLSANQVLQLAIGKEDILSHNFIVSDINSLNNVSSIRIDSGIGQVSLQPTGKGGDDFMVVLSNYIARTEQRIYHIDFDCENTLEIHWLNEYGAVDSYDFDWFKMAHTISSNSYFNNLQKRLLGQVKTRYKVETYALLDDEYEWLLGLSKAIHSQVTVGNTTQECIIKDSTQENDRLKSNLLQFEIELSELELTHSN